MLSPHELRLFVPGRVCLLGEHSDWAGGFRRGEHSRSIHAGQCLVYGTDVGIFATASLVKAAEGGTGRITMSGVSVPRDVAPLSAPLDASELEQLARAGGFFSYVCGTAAVMVRRIGAETVQGWSVDIDVTQMTLPMGKGLSSSAAVTVLVARAFGHLFGHHMTVEDEMDAAYRGERLTPSLCGRMDQCCAFGSRFVSMTFAGDDVKAEAVHCPKPIYFVVADLGAAKNTPLILSSLGSAFPDAEGTTSSGVRHFLGEVSWSLVEAAKEALGRGDAEALGVVFTEAQKRFDEYLTPACPEELTSPRLHYVLRHPAVLQHTLGGKGVGSQGDGSIQFVCKDADQQQKTLVALSELGCTPFAFTVGGTN